METLHPLVFWAQTAEKVTLRVELREVSSPKIEIKENELIFQGYGEGARGLHEYEFRLEFNDEINIEESAYRISERQIDFSLFKAYKDTWWARLTKKKTKLNWLRIDFDRWRNEDDSEDEKQEEDEHKLPSSAEMEQVKKLEKEILEVKDKAFTDIKACYLFFYNMIQFSSYGCAFCYLMQRYAIHGKDNMREAFDVSVQFVGICQVLACLELIHAITGLVKSGLLAVFIQLSGRNIVLFCVILPALPLHSEPMVCYLLLVWSAVEVIRYPFYAFASIDLEFEVLTWLRYTIWIPLYPLGLMSEAIVILLALPYYQETEQFSLYLPNNYNIAIYFPYYLYFHLVSIVVGGLILMKHMWTMRTKKLATTTKSNRKQKTS